jgi:hypothetical protein
MIKKWMFTGLAILAIFVAGCGGSSGWSSADKSKVESKIADEITASGGTPTKAEAQCIVKGLEPNYSASTVLNNSALSSSQHHEVEQITRKCLGASSTSGSSGSNEKIYGPACQKNLQSAACIEEGVHVGGAIKEGEAKSEEYAKEAETQVKEEKARIENPAGSEQSEP